MKKLIFLIPFLLIGCAPKIVYVPVETIRTITERVVDTVISVKLVPSYISVKTKDTTSTLKSPYAISYAMWSNGNLTHSLETKNVVVPVNVHYINTTIHDTSTIVLPISKADQNKINGYDKLKASSKSRGSTIWKLIGLLAISMVVILRKPIWLLISKLIKPI